MLSDAERAWLTTLADAADAAKPIGGAAWQGLIFSSAKEGGLPPARAFAALYAALLGRSNGPRAGWLLAALDHALVVARLRAAGSVAGAAQ